MSYVVVINDVLGEGCCNKGCNDDVKDIGMYYVVVINDVLVKDVAVKDVVM